MKEKCDLDFSVSSNFILERYNARPENEFFYAKIFLKVETKLNGQESCLPLKDLTRLLMETDKVNQFLDETTGCMIEVKENLQRKTELPLRSLTCDSVVPIKFLKTNFLIVMNNAKMLDRLDLCWEKYLKSLVMTELNKKEKNLV